MRRNGYVVYIVTFTRIKSYNRFLSVKTRLSVELSKAIRPVTIRTIAAAAGVSVASVSRALRGVRGVVPSERDRIRAVAERLGYRPNPFVAAFTAQVRTYRRNPRPATLAVLDCWPVSRPTWANFDSSLDYMSGIRRRAETLGYDVDVVRLTDLGGSIERLQRLLVTRRIYGLLVLPVPEGTDLSGLDFSQIACSTIDFTLQQPLLIRRASTNYHQNMSLALAVLAERGYKRIGYITTQNSSQRLGDLALSAFLAFRLRHPNLCLPPCLVPLPSARQDLAAWLDRERPDAVVSCDFVFPEDVAAGGWRVPRDVGCVALARPAVKGHLVAHINENYQQVGAEAVDMIVDAIHRNEFGLPSTRIVHFVDGCWHEGATLRTGP